MLRLKIDPWSADYGPSLVMEELTEEELRLDLEGEWSAREPAQPDFPARVALVDGVRRVDMHLRLENQTRHYPALVGTVGVAALHIRLGQPTNLNEALGNLQIQQYLLVAGPEGPDPNPLPQTTVLCTGGPAEALLQTLQQQMRSLESEVAGQAAEQADLVIADGPLQNMHGLKDKEVLGYIKSQHRQLLPAEKLDTVRQLRPGQRSPLFGLGSGNFDRISWYVRLDAPLEQETSLAGIVRVEVSARHGLENARRRADQSCHLLPRLRNSRCRDARSPQNLIPIAVLEAALRHRFGSSDLRQRQLRQALKGGAA